MKLDSVLGRAFLSVAGMGVQGVARFVYTLLIGRIAGPETLSDITSLLSLAIYLSLFWPAGAAQAAARYLPLPQQAASSFRILLHSFWLASTVLALCAFPLALWLSHDPLTAAACAFFVFCHNAYVFTRGVLVGQDRLVRAVVGDTLSSLLSLTLLLLVILAGLSSALLLPLAFGYLLFALLALHRQHTGSRDTTHRREILIFTRDATLGALVTGGLLPATMIFVRAFDTSRDAGMFAAALTLATPLNMVAQALNQVLLPHFTRLRADPEEQQRSHNRILLLTAVGFSLGFGLLILLAPWLMTTIYGPQYSDGTLAMQVLLVIVLLFSINAAPSAQLLATGRQKTYARVWLIAFAVGTLVMLVASPVWGQWGALLGFGLGGGGGSLAIVALGYRRPAHAVLHDDERREEHRTDD
ncbi:MAG: lipopolysaccharide biosynthesis protein [Actinobacteria bacterium]|nr:lipopolysaccharide biosynthesis protein [Actinomycetota bacterium]